MSAPRGESRTRPAAQRVEEGSFGRRLRAWREQHAWSLVSSLGRFFQRPFATLLTVGVMAVAMALPLARYLREHTPQAYIPIIVVSGDVQERLESRSFNDNVTDYFDKSLGFNALAAFIKGYVSPESEPGGEVLYVEDSRVVALATRRMLEKHGLQVIHCTCVEDAVAHLETMKAQDRVPGPDVVLTDVYLKGDLTGKDLVQSIRNDFNYPKGLLPVLVMTGDANPSNQTDLLRAGANDLVQKPIEERLLVTKLLFQLRVGRLMRERASPPRARGAA